MEADKFMKDVDVILPSGSFTIAHFFTRGYKIEQELFRIKEGLVTRKALSCKNMDKISLYLGGRVLLPSAFSVDLEHTDEPITVEMDVALSRHN